MKPLRTLIIVIIAVISLVACVTENKLTGISNLSEKEQAYTKDSNHACHIDSIIESVDPESLEVLDSYFCRDKSNVFFHGEIQDDIDAATFKSIPNIKEDIFGAGLYQDANAVYRVVMGEGGGIVLFRYENADLETFEVLAYGVAKDKYRVYYYSDVLEGADPTTFEIPTGQYFKDKERVYFRGEPIEADPGTLEALGSSPVYAKDKDHIYYLGEVLSGVDYDTFEFINRDYTKDKENVFYRNVIIEGADPDSFVVLDFPYSKDKYRKYEKDQIVSE